MKTFLENQSKENLIPIIDNVDANTIYIGYAMIWVGENEPKWKIKKVVTTWTVTRFKYPITSWKPNKNFAFAWNDRLTLTY